MVNDSAVLAANGQTEISEDGSLVLTGARQLIRGVREGMTKSGITLERLAEAAGKGDAPAISKLLDEMNPHTLFRVLSATIVLDRERAFLRRANAMVGCECKPREVLTDAQFRARVLAYSRRTKAGSAWLEEALEETP
jgi:hypothetical protein